MKIDLDPHLASRLATAARQLGRDPAECARSAILSFVVSCEEAWSLRQRLGGGEHWVREQDWSD